MIRYATYADLIQLQNYGSFFWRTTPYYGKLPYNPKAVRSLIETIIDDHYLSVYEDGDVIIGFLGMLITPLIFNPDYTVATEVFFFVNPARRGNEVGAQLLARAEDQLADDVDIMVFGDMSTSTDMTEMYTRNGYVSTERSFTKVL